MYVIGRVLNPPGYFAPLKLKERETSFGKKKGWEASRSGKPRPNNTNDATTVLPNICLWTIT